MNEAVGLTGFYKVLGLFLAPVGVIVILLLLIKLMTTGFSSKQRGEK